MKIIINENQINKLYPVLKKMWDKKEYPTYNDELYKYLGLEPKYRDQINKMFYDYLGTDEIEERIERLISDYSTWTEINNCGGYNFRFVLDWFEVDYDDVMVYIGARYDGDGTVLNFDNELLTLDDAVNDYDYGHEYISEISDCILQQIHIKLLNETGLHAYIEF
jgi:hypothetical protein